MSSYVSLAELGPGVEVKNIPSMRTQQVPITYSAGYNALTHNVIEPDNYFEFPNAYFIPEIKESGYKFYKRKCNGSKLYPLDANL